MATNATNVYWSKDFTPTAGSLELYGIYIVDGSTDPPHECDVIQRLSEAWRSLQAIG